MLEQLGLSETASTAQRKLAGARTREAKQPAGQGGDLRELWRGQAAAAGVDVDQLLTTAVPGHPRPVSAARPDQGLAEQLAATIFHPETGLTAHRKVVGRTAVLAAVLEALPDGVADLAAADRLVEEVLAVPGYAVRLPDSGAVHLTGHERFTTTDIVAAERAILAAARDRYAAASAVVDQDVAARAIDAYETAAGFELSGEQRVVLDRLLHAGHGVDAVIGVAGSGKTTIMAALRAAHEAAGHTVAGASTAAVAAANLQAESGIASSTVASWLWQIEHGQGLAGVDVLVVDEAAMVDDRQMARLAAAAGQTGTQIVGIGDPKQLRAVGVGGGFAAVHELVDGLTLADNRRQVDQAERAALTLWRNEKRLEALLTWADAGRVHAADDAGQAHAGMLAVWDRTRREITDPHDRIAGLLLMAGTNADVDQLNAAAQAIRIAAGELDPAAGRTYRLAGGDQVVLHVGEQVMLRRNDRRSRTTGGADVLNGYRGVITSIDRAGRVSVTWRQTGPDGPVLVTEQVDPAYVAAGGVQLGYAITVAKAQGLTSDRSVVYGAGLDANTLYSAMSRARHRVDLVLPRTLLETDTDRARLGEPASQDEALRRAINAYATKLAGDRPDRLVSTQLDELQAQTRDLRDRVRRLRRTVDPAPAGSWRSARTAV